MTCRQTVVRLMDYVEQRLGARERRALESHLAACAVCRGFVRSYRRTPAIVRRATVAHVPASVARRLRRRLQSLD